MSLYSSNTQRFEKENQQSPPSSQFVVEGDSTAGSRAGAGTTSGQSGHGAAGSVAHGPRLISLPFTSTSMNDHGGAARTGVKRSAEAAGLYWTPLGKLYAHIEQLRVTL